MQTKAEDSGSISHLMLIATIVEVLLITIVEVLLITVRLWNFNSSDAGIDWCK